VFCSIFAVPTIACPHAIDTDAVTRLAAAAASLAVKLAR
jgi:hypothetical protein